MKDGIPRVDRESMKLYVGRNVDRYETLVLISSQALEYGEIRGMADRAALFKYGLDLILINHEY